MKAQSFSRFMTLFLGYTFVVILWGAFVRISFSGDGCGDHWPLCKGEVLPTAATSKTWVELSHRITSMVAWILALINPWLAFKTFPKQHPARKTSLLTFLFMSTEALIGAGLVLFEMVAENKSIARGWWVSAHLINTFVLVMTMTLSLWFSKQTKPPRFALKSSKTPIAVVVLGSFMVLSMSGGITALGDTLFPSETFIQGVRLNFDPNAHLFIRLRILHPILAILVSGVIAAFLGYTFFSEQAPSKTAYALTTFVLFGQVGLGFINMLLHAPAWIQLIHLLLADLIWVGLVWIMAEWMQAPASNNALLRQ